MSKALGTINKLISFKAVTQCCCRNISSQSLSEFQLLLLLVTLRYLPHRVFQVNIVYKFLDCTTILLWNNKQLNPNLKVAKTVAKMIKIPKKNFDHNFSLKVAEFVKNRQILQHCGLPSQQFKEQRFTALPKINKSLLCFRSFTLSAYFNFKW